jgi:nucleotide-binding universal stress UspA family protein
MKSTVMSPHPSEHLESRAGSEAAQAVFRQLLCGVDATPQSLEAVRQGEQLRAEGGNLIVISALDTGARPEAGWAATQAAEGLRAEAKSALDAARAEVPDALFQLVEGRPDQVLLAQAEQLHATLVVVGTHGISRPIGIALGSAATLVLHGAPCSVVVARERPKGRELPRSIVVGVDGSVESAAAVAVGRVLADRFQVDAQLLAVRNGKGFDQAAVDAIADDVRFEDGRPVEMLVGTAREDDLLIVGSRGLHGVRALGSVSERVAHKAHCSVLVVRPPKTP